MNGTRFDYVAQRLAQIAERRTRRRGLLAVAVALVNGASTASDAAAAKRRRHRRGDDAEAEACIPTGKRCPAPKPRGRKGNGKQGKKPKQLSCRQCCQRRVTTNANGKKVCFCAETGTACTETRECCDGTCTGGLCQLTATAPSSPPAGCTPTTCAAQGANCGSIPDGCGGTLSCGSCSNPTPVCVRNTCTACTTTAQCPAGTICDAGACQGCDISCGNQAPETCGERLQTMLVNGPDRIRVCPGTYREIFSIGRTLTLIGAGEGEDPATNTILQGVGDHPVVAITGGFEVTLQRLRITGGGGRFGGGIRNLGGSLTLIASTVTGNTAEDNGGGIYNDNGSILTLTNSTVTRNTANDGGGILNEAGSSLTLTNSTVSGNTARFGGGMFTLSGSTLTLIDSSVTGNTARQGGGIRNIAGNVSIDDASRVTRNTADFEGGGIYNAFGGTVNLASDRIVIDNCPDNCAGDPVANCAATPVFCPPPP